jgi:type I restriction enzyme S subunit
VSWMRVKLKDCCDVVGGATPKRNVDEYWNSKDIPWITPKDISNLKQPVLEDAPEYISHIGFKSCATYLLPKGSVLLTSRAPIGNLAIAGRDMCTNQGFKCLVPNNDVDGTYLYYCMMAYSEKLKVLGNGATFKEVSKKIVEEFEIPLPPLPEQKRIAAILDKADSLRRKNQQAIQLADQFIRAVFLELFGDPVTNPKGWEVKPLSEITEFENGDRSSNYPSGDDIKNIGILFLNTKNIIDGKIAFKDTAFITREKFDSLGRGKLQKDDLVITLRGTLGSCAKFNCDYETGFINAQLMIIRTGERVDSDFLHALLTSVPIQKKLKSIGNGAAVPQLTASQLKLFEFYLPPLTEQLKFKDILNKCQKLGKLSNKAQSDKLFNSLSQKAFAGGL